MVVIEETLVAEHERDPRSHSAKKLLHDVPIHENPPVGLVPTGSI